jgi:serine/threonine protein kinase
LIWPHPPGERAYTMCATGDYCTPEMLLMLGTSRASDLWSLGVFIFELTAGYSPFAAATRDKMFRNIIAADLAQTIIPAQMDPRCADMVSLLLVKDEEARLGMGEEGFDAIKVGAHCIAHFTTCVMMPCAVLATHASSVPRSWFGVLAPCVH